MRPPTPEIASLARTEPLKLRPRRGSPQNDDARRGLGLIRMLAPVSLQQLLKVIAEFDDSGGASLGLVAWELCVDEDLVAPAWQQATNHGLMSPAGRDCHEQLWRLNAAGQAATRSERRSS